ncbi:MAG TPA: 3-deoxy-7-phosphoheptulonate synthase, partial [Firmicutes bacterium]|nr:3-deoxy-7-phosphoheptulonate synthase [Candidatus Fermentithermobacillaceae bacterium]
MIVVMNAKASPRELDRVTGKIQESGLETHISAGTERTIIGIIGGERHLDVGQIEVLPGVERIIRVLRPFKLASMEFRQRPTVIRLSAGLEIGGRGVVIMAGPCAIENQR